MAALVKKCMAAAALAGMLAVWPAAPQQTERAELLFKAAVHRETIDGDLKGAIDQYRKVLARAGANRALAAQALMRIGQCYEKLGDKEARSAYERLVREYADQGAIASQARARLAALIRPRTAPGGDAISFRHIWPDRGVDTMGSPSPDGRYLSFVDWSTGGDLAIRDLITGQNRRITDRAKSKPPSSWQPSTSIFSPDGKQLACVWYSEQDPPEIRLIGVDGSGARTIYKAPRWQALDIHDWSPDGGWVIASLQDGVLLLISAHDGSVRPLKKVDRAGRVGRVHPRFSPDGRFIAYDAALGSVERRSEVRLLSVDGTRDIKLGEGSLHDFPLGWAGGGRYLLFASDRSGTNDIWAQAMINGEPQGPPRLLKRDAGQVWPMGVSRDGTFFYELNTSMSDIYVAELDVARRKVVSAPKVVSHRFVGNNGYPHWSPDGKQLVFVSHRPMGDTTLVIQDLQSGNEREIRPPLEFFVRPAWRPDGKAIVVWGTAVDNVTGSYTVDLASGETTLLLDAKRIPGVMADVVLSADSKTLWAYTVDTIYRLNRQTGTLDQLFSVPQKVALGVALLGLSPDESQLAFQIRNYPPGVTSLVTMPVSGGPTREILRMAHPDQFHCCRALSWTADSKYVLGVHWRSGEDHDDIWLVPVNGGEPVKTGINMRGMRQPHLHPDGRRLVFKAGDDAVEVWVMENFLPAIESAAKSGSH